jgi:XTP/dITP diphosphohydrolase
MNAERVLVLASGNAGKLAELQDALQQWSFRLRAQSEWLVSDAVEDGLSFVENAIIKARHAAGLTGQPALADDSGLVVPVLDGAPGIHSARYAGEHGDDQANCDRLLAELDGKTDRRAWFQCVLVLMRHAEDPSPLIASACWHGEILTSPRGAGGFGYDPLFIPSGAARSAAELSREEKRLQSHRGQAVRALAAALADAAW